MEGLALDRVFLILARMTLAMNFIQKPCYPSLAPGKCLYGALSFRSGSCLPVAHGGMRLRTHQLKAYIFQIWEAIVSEAWLPGFKPRGAGVFVLWTEAPDAKALKHGHTLNKGEN